MDRIQQLRKPIVHICESSSLAGRNAGQIINCSLECFFRNRFLSRRNDTDISCDFEFLIRHAKSPLPLDYESTTGRDSPYEKYSLFPIMLSSYQSPCQPASIIASTESNSTFCRPSICFAVYEKNTLPRYTMNFLQATSDANKNPYPVSSPGITLR